MFPARNPTPWTHYLASGLVTLYITMHIIAGVLEKVAPQTVAWARKEVQRVRDNTGR